MMDAFTEHLLREQFAFVASLPPAQLARLKACARMKIPAGGQVFHDRSPCKVFPLLLDGAVRVYQSSPTLQDITLYRWLPGQSCFVSAASLLGQTDSMASAQAESAVMLLCVPQSLFDELVISHAAFRRFIFHDFAERLAAVMVQMQVVDPQTLDQRLAAWIMENAPVARATDQQIADELGSVSETVSRLLGEFSEHGWVHLGRERVRILDPVALQKLAEGRRA